MYILTGTDSSTCVEVLKDEADDNQCLVDGKFLYSASNCTESPFFKIVMNLLITNAISTNNISKLETYLQNMNKLYLLLNHPHIWC